MASGFVAFVTACLSMVAWTARDCRRRDSKAGWFWVLLILYANVLGLMLYVLTRPRGRFGGRDPLLRFAGIVFPISLLLLFGGGLLCWR